MQAQIALEHNFGCMHPTWEVSAHYNGRGFLIPLCKGYRHLPHFIKEVRYHGTESSRIY